jgi:hypothetical protein
MRIIPKVLFRNRASVVLKERMEQDKKNEVKLDPDLERLMTPSVTLQDVMNKLEEVAQRVERIEAVVASLK